MRTWNEFFEEKESEKNESFYQDMLDGSNLDTGDFVSKNVTGWRMDADYENDPKEYEKLQKFLKGTNKPDNIDDKDGWFIVKDE